MTAIKQPCFIVGGGPSLIGFDWSSLNNHFTIAINNSYKVLPQASIVYFTDNDWWNTHKDSLLQHQGKLIKGSVPSQLIKHPKVKEYHLVQAEGISHKKGELAHGYNSVYAAINLAVKLGFKTIYLLGVDMGWNDKGESHWHTDHKRIDDQVVYGQMRRAFQTLGEPLSQLGVQVINLNPHSYLDCFEKIPYNEVIRWG